MIIVPECARDKVEELISRNLKYEIISDEEYIKRYGVESLEIAKR